MSALENAEAVARVAALKRYELRRGVLNDLLKDGTSLGTILRCARNQKGMSLQQLAEYMGCGIVYLSDVERSLRRPTMLRLQRWADILGLDARDLELFVGGPRSDAAKLRRALQCVWWTPTEIDLALASLYWGPLKLPSGFWCSLD